MISMIWAMDEDNLIGDKDRLPWHIPKDLKYFKEVTENKIVLVGENTYLSLLQYYKNKALPYSKIYVASKNNVCYNNVTMVNDLDSFLNNLRENIIVIGGKAIYEYCFPYASVLYITVVKGHHNGDIYIKKFDMSNYKLTYMKEEIDLTFFVYRKVENI